MPRIPRREALAAAAHRHHAALQRLPRGTGDAGGGNNSTVTNTLASLSAAEEAAADGLLLAVRSHLCAALLEPVRAHALTEVDAKGERVSVLLYDTYVASFAEAAAYSAGGGGGGSGGGGGGGGSGSGGGGGGPFGFGGGSNSSAAVAAGERAFAAALVETQLFGAAVDEILGD